ncbi:MAG TPA: c-type cytochrome [Gemmatales bacterium]|nr:c-type cytochrome [Gemmatales bacterium]
MSTWKCTRLVCSLFSSLVLLFGTLWTLQAQNEDDSRQKPLSAREALASFRIDPRFSIELVAAEPEVIDPVCFCFDAWGDLYVVEMRGYPNAGVGTGEPNLPGRIQRLTDTDGDGYYETATTIAEGLRFPCGITPWRDGFLVGDAPDLLFISRDGNEKRVLYTGFGNSNIQQMLNGLQLHYDGWVYGCNGGNDSPVRSVEKPEAPVVQLRGKHFRFQPDVPGSLQPCSGGGQYGLAVTTAGQWLTCTNSQHLRQIVLPMEYLNRNSLLSAGMTTVDIPDHGPAARVFRISPFEAWRLERTTRRASSTEARRFPSTELVPGGFMTSACGLNVYEGGTFPVEYRGNVFVCDPANNLIHRDILQPDGSILRASRQDHDCEFLASTDTWFRPVFLHTGPDGALYVADFYREIIETPLSLPDDIKARWNLNSRSRGRLWRIKPKKPTVELPAWDAKEPIRELTSPNQWRRNTAFRLLLQHGNDFIKTSHEDIYQQLTQQAVVSPEAIGLLRETGWNGQQRQELLCRWLQPGADTVLQRQALVWCEKLASLEPEIEEHIHTLITQGDSQVRFQLALSLGSLPITGEKRLALAARMLEQSSIDSWLETALLTSLAEQEYALFLRLLVQPCRSAFLERLAQLVARREKSEKLLAEPALQQVLHGPWGERQLAILTGLGREFVQRWPMVLERLEELLRNAEVKESERAKAITLLGYLPWAKSQTAFAEQFNPSSSPMLQRATLAALRGYAEPEMARLLLDQYSGFSPAIRREAQEILLSREPFISLLLDRVEAGHMHWNQLDPERRERLYSSRNESIRQRARALQTNPGSRAKVLEQYQQTLEMPGDVARGKLLFAQHCAACHRLEEVGHAVGPDLQGALTNKTATLLLQDILDPNREVDPRYISYVLVTKNGRTVTGILRDESAAGITLQRAEGVEETILRTEVEEMTSSNKSLMPENLEEQLKPQDLVDVIAYLLKKRN